MNIVNIVIHDAMVRSSLLTPCRRATQMGDELTTGNAKGGIARIVFLDGLYETKNPNEEMQTWTLNNTCHEIQYEISWNWIVKKSGSKYTWKCAQGSANLLKLGPIIKMVTTNMTIWQNIKLYIIPSCLIVEPCKMIRTYDQNKEPENMGKPVWQVWFTVIHWTATPCQIAPSFGVAHQPR